ncbi:hypothetical protein [Flavobacterium orientale]|uniref:Uncharacterized protein n=1 Tax=Flavobacterium orientale TaxID=1756020 RepID=A0A916Y8H3_9FLAO|nr:hypothetical protein [Flavobacterium orientale]GGD35306.1 hypothetical protein GCM10011343_26430 [Flavobacterium orientale]
MLHAIPKESLQIPEALLPIITRITNYLDVSRIYCFGKRQFTKQQNSAIFKEDKEVTLAIHYDLLVFTIKSYPSGIAGLQDEIATTSNVVSTATLFLHREIHLQQLRDEQQYFFYSIMKPENLVFEQSNYYFKPLPFSNPKIPINNLTEVWKTRVETARSFIAAVKPITKSSASGSVIIFNLHQAAEQLCLGLIAVFLNYYPNYYHLPYLFSICAHFTDLVSDLFICIPENKKNLIGMLTQNVSYIRKEKPLVLTNEGLYFLENTLENFLNESNKLVAQKLKNDVESQIKINQ